MNIAELLRVANMALIWSYLPVSRTIRSQFLRRRESASSSFLRARPTTIGPSTSMPVAWAVAKTCSRSSNSGHGEADGADVHNHQRRDWRCERGQPHRPICFGHRGAEGRVRPEGHPHPPGRDHGGVEVQPARDEPQPRRFPGADPDEAGETRGGAPRGAVEDKDDLKPGAD